MLLTGQFEGWQLEPNKYTHHSTHVLAVVHLQVYVIAYTFSFFMLYSSKPMEDEINDPVKTL